LQSNFKTIFNGKIKPFFMNLLDTHEMRDGSADAENAPSNAAQISSNEPAQTLESRNWELELLVSGAVFFSLFQLPGLIQEYLTDVVAHGGGVFAVVGLLYAKSISYLLIVNLGGHFLLRGYWVGLLGLASVFPKGIIWENLPYTDHRKEFYKLRTRSVVETAASVDSLCRMIFGFTFFVLLVILGICGFYALIGGVTLLISALAPEIEIAIIAAAVFAVFYLPLVLVPFAEFVFKKKSLSKNPRYQRFIVALTAWGQTITLSKLSLGIMFTLRSNIARWKILLTIWIFMGGVIFAPLLEILLRYDNYVFFPEDDSRYSMEAAYYENMRSQEGNVIDRTLFRLPSIQSDALADEPYIKLFLPYRSADNDSIRARLPRDFPAFHPEGLFFASKRDENDSTRALALKAIASIYQISLNDSALPSLEYHFFRRHLSGLPGIMTYIPTAGLPNGRNMLHISRFQGKHEFWIPFYR
jgi:hypothetical protein